jgi:hypothetical protein
MKKLGWFLLGAISLLAIQALAIAVVLARARSGPGNTCGVSSS